MESGYKSFKKKPRTRKRTHRVRHPNRLPEASEARAELERLALKRGALVTAPDGLLAVEVMDQRIAHFEKLMTTLYPWDADGNQLKGKSVQAYYWASEMQRDYVQMRAPYQSPRLSAVQVVTGTQQQRDTEVHVTILNEKGDVEYSDGPEDEDMKLIEQTQQSDDEAA